MEQNSLNNLHLEYSKNQISINDFEGSVYHFLAKNQDKTILYHWKKEEYEDFLSWFYPRLHKAVKRYETNNTTFETYISSIIRVASKEYRIRSVTKSVIENSTWSVRIPELYAHEEAHPYSYENQEKTVTENPINKKIKNNPKQLLALILKCYYYVSDEFLDKIACHTGIDRNELREAVNKIKEVRQKKDDKIYNMKERIYAQYYRCIVYENRLKYLGDTPIEYEKIKNRLEKARKRLAGMRKRIIKIRTDATNKEIAEVIGVSKGTVDASLHRLKLKLETLANNSELN